MFWILDGIFYFDVDGREFELTVINDKIDDFYAGGIFRAGDEDDLGRN